MANANFLLNGNLRVIDSINIETVSKSLDRLYQGSACIYKQAEQIDNTDHVIELPASVCTVLYLRAIDNSLIVKWTPNGGAEATIVTIPANGILLMLFSSGNGITTLTLKAGASSVLFDAILGA